MLANEKYFKCAESPTKDCILGDGGMGDDKTEAVLQNYSMR